MAKVQNRPTGLRNEAGHLLGQGRRPSQNLGPQDRPNLFPELRRDKNADYPDCFKAEKADYKTNFPAKMLVKLSRNSAKKTIFIDTILPFLCHFKQ
ncbi:MAG: hypothetical protein K9K65_01735 [Desulfarculaceae bacterium]|nr:hypothetical protein [Desulfarculaceae bacterium]MCF8096538.1 hypothetical protein [Desulfarculaceae bacterium]